MYILGSCSNITKAISVVVLMSSPYAVADIRTTEVSSFNTLADFTVSETITGKLENVNSISRDLTIVGSTIAISNEVPTPRTEIGRKLLELRRKVLARGIKLLTADEINLMVKEGRGDFS